MPVSTKCWYRDCNSQSRQDPKLLFYRFPKDPDRCQQWVYNCSNPELTRIYNSNPDKFANLRICQKHFLKEFLGTSSRLVGHAIPAPYGTALEGLEAERFMVGCASLKSSTSGICLRQSQLQQQEQLPKESVPTLVNDLFTEQVLIIDDNDDTFRQPLIDHSHSDLVVSTNEPLAPFDHDRSYQLLEGDIGDSTDTHSNLLNNYESTSYKGQSSEFTDLIPDPFHTASSNTDYQQLETCIPCHSSYNAQEDIEIDGSIQPTSSMNYNPKINYDREGRVVSIQYPKETLSLVRTDEREQYDAHISALKNKIRFYQRKLAVINHRYQKLRVQMKRRSNKTRLLESLKLCKGDLDPCVFELFKRQVKGPSSKHGNRWSMDLKSFSASIYLQSRSAYKLIRKTIDLPSEFIVKQYISEKKLTRLSNSTDNEEETGEKEVLGGVTPIVQE